MAAHSASSPSRWAPARSLAIPAGPAAGYPALWPATVSAPEGGVYPSRLVGDAEALPGVARLLEFVDHGDGVVFHRYAASAFSVDHQLVAAQAEGCRCVLPVRASRRG